MLRYLGAASENNSNWLRVVHVRKTSSVNDSFLFQFLPSRGCFLLVDRIGLLPMIFWNNPKLNFRIREHGDAAESLPLDYHNGLLRSFNSLLELVRELYVIEKNPRVLEVGVESVLNSTHAPNDIVEVAIARKHQQRRVCPLAGWRLPFVVSARGLVVLVGNLVHPRFRTAPFIFYVVYGRCPAIVFVCKAQN